MTFVVLPKEQEITAGEISPLLTSSANPTLLGSRPEYPTLPPARTALVPGTLLSLLASLPAALG